MAELVCIPGGTEKDWFRGICGPGRNIISSVGICDPICCPETCMSLECDIAP